MFWNFIASGTTRVASARTSSLGSVVAGSAPSDSRGVREVTIAVAPARILTAEEDPTISGGSVASPETHNVAPLFTVMRLKRFRTAAEATAFTPAPDTTTWDPSGGSVSPLQPAASPRSVTDVESNRKESSPTTTASPLSRTFIPTASAAALTATRRAAWGVETITSSAS